MNIEVDCFEDNMFEICVKIRIGVLVIQGVFFEYRVVFFKVVNDLIFSKEIEIEVVDVRELD